MIRYSHAPDINHRVKAIAARIGLDHDFSRVICIRSHGSASKRTIARCHALPRVMQTALGIESHYVIEVLSENFDTLNEESQTKALIHELMHIPRSFGGGLRRHDHVTRRSVEIVYEKYKGKR